MTTLKKMAAFVAALLVSVIFTGCEGSEIMEYFGAAPEKEYVTQEVLVEKDKLYPVLSNVLISDKSIFINNKSVATYSVEHELPTIEKPVSQHAAAGIVEYDGENLLRDSNGQTTTMSVTITPSADNSYTLDAKITPIETQYSKITNLHKKVTLVTTYYNFSGHVSVTTDGETKANDFSLTITRHYLLVDPSVDIETVVLTDTIEKLVVHTDTIINTVEVEKIVHDTLTVEKTVTVHDTITIEVDRFIRGNDVHKSIINEFGNATGTLLLGNKQLVNIELRLQKPVIDVNTFGVEIGQTSALEWKGTDGQWIIGTSAANGATVSSIEFVRVENNVLAEDNLVQIRLVYLAKGTYKNENGDSYEFEMELRPSYLQKIDKVVVVDHDKIVEIYNGVWFDGKNFTINGALAGTVDVAHKKQLIELPIAQHKEASITSENGLTWKDSNGQTTNGTCKVYGNAGLTMSLKPAADYSSIMSIHPKVSLITTHHDLTGQVSVGNTTENFAFVLDRSYLLSDPTVDIQVIEKTDTIEKLVIRTDTVIVEKEVEKIVNHTDTIYKEVEKLVTVHDTLTVEVERFVKGADVRTIVVNDFGTATGTLTLGDKQLLKVTLEHEQPVIEVAEEQLGKVSFSNIGTLKWQGTDTQITNGTQSGNATVTSFKYDRVEYKTITAGALVLVRTFYIVKGTYVNENGDSNDFEMELAPSYLQKYEAPAPEVVTPDVTLYRGIIRSLSVDGLKLMTKPILQVWNKETNKWDDKQTFKRTCIGLSGSPTGLDLFVKSTTVVEETENSWWYSGEDATWTGSETKSDGVVVTKRTKVYEFNHLFWADAVANGKVGPATQLYVMRAEAVQVPDPEGNLLTCVWEDGSEFSLSISVVMNNTEFVEKPEMVGQTRTESDKQYKYATSFVQHFTSSLGGKKLQDVDATSTLWIPVQ
jgi:hypothetical protein